MCAITCKQCTKLREDNAKLLNKIELMTLSEEAFAQDDEKVKFYTGLLNYGARKSLIHFVSHQTENKSKLNTF